MNNDKHGWDLSFARRRRRVTQKMKGKGMVHHEIRETHETNGAKSVLDFSLSAG